MTKEFQTLRGALSGNEPDEEIHFAYSATLRIFGDGLDLDGITSAMGIQPTHTHHKGEKAGTRSPGYKHDMWSYEAKLQETEPLENHIAAVWSQFKAHKDYLLKLKEKVAVDVFLGYRSNCDHAGIEVPYTALEMFTELQIPFGVSIIIA